MVHLPAFSHAAAKEVPLKECSKQSGCFTNLLRWRLVNWSWSRPSPVFRSLESRLKHKSQRRFRIHRAMKGQDCITHHDISYFLHFSFCVLYVHNSYCIGLRGLRQGARNCIWLPLLEKEPEEAACQFPALGLRKGSKEWVSTHNIWLQTLKKRCPESMPNKFDSLTLWCFMMLWHGLTLQFKYVCCVTVCSTQTWLNFHVQASIGLVTLWGRFDHFHIWHRHSKCAAAIGEVAAAIRCVGQHQKGSQVTPTIQANPPFPMESLVVVSEKYLIYKYFYKCSIYFYI